ncbi:MAG TPA: type IV secretion system protein [Bryobacteraceae bacterium]|nr:type IV secretion system protein [Bryobacteraceae bacterium]
MANQGLFVQITQATIDLITKHMDLFVATGRHMFTVFATLLVIWEGLQFALAGVFHAPRFAALVMAIAIDGAMIHFYDQPFPGTGSSFHKLVTDTGANLASQVEESSEEQVGMKIANATEVIIVPVGLNFWEVSPIIYYYASIFIMSAAQIALLGVIAFGFVAAGCIVLVGPVFVPFFIVPRMDWIFWGWFKALLQYSFYPVIANAFVYVYGQIWLNFFDQNGFPDTLDKLAGMFIQIVILAITFVWGVLQVPKLVSNIFAGQSGLDALPGIGWWR